MSRAKATKVSKEREAALDEERYAENRQALEAAHKLAVKVFGEGLPADGGGVDPDAVFGVSEVIAGFDGDAELAESHLGEAQKVAKGLYDRCAVLLRCHFPTFSSADVLTVADVLLLDESAEAHLKEAAEVAWKLFGSGALFEVVLDVYYEVYGEDDEDDEQE